MKPRQPTSGLTAVSLLPLPELSARTRTAQRLRAVSAALVNPAVQELQGTRCSCALFISLFLNNPLARGALLRVALEWATLQVISSAMLLPCKRGGTLAMMSWRLA